MIQMDGIEKSAKAQYRELIIMRALPGTGKSTRANAIKDWFENNGYQVVICGTDEYFTDEHGNYNWSANLIKEAHNWNVERAREYMSNGVNVVIIDNTNVQFWEAEKYIKIGLEHRYIVRVEEVKTPWAGNIDELVQRNVHRVPRESIERMRDKWESQESFDEKIQALVLTTKRNGV